MPKGSEPWAEQNNPQTIKKVAAEYGRATFQSKSKVRKEVKKGLRELENTLNNTSRTSDGNLKFISGVNEDPESFIGKGWNLDV